VRARAGGLSSRCTQQKHPAPKSAFLLFHFSTLSRVRAEQVMEDASGPAESVFCRLPQLPDKKTFGSWVGTGGRRMCGLPALASALAGCGAASASAAVRAVHDGVHALAARDIVPVWGRRMRCQGGVALSNHDVDGVPVAIQDLHLDMEEAGLALFLGIEKTSLHVVFLSHSAVAMTWAARGDAAELARIDAAFPDRLQLLTLEYEPGELVLMHGLSVHAGAAGSAGQTALRCHWYLQESPIVARDGHVYTHPLLAVGSALARKCCMPSS
jgi:hypothetical protein